MKVASIATYAGRLDVLPDAVRSLAGQVDLIHIYYNGKVDDTGWKELQVNLIRECGDMGGELSDCVVEAVEDKADLSKFRAIWDYPDATIFTCDDDLIYSPDYIRQLTKCLHYDSMVKADVVSIGGKQISDVDRMMKAKTFKDCFGQRFSCFVVPPTSDKDSYNFMYPEKLHVPLSGVAAFDASKFQDCTIDEVYKYAADIQLGAWIAEKGYEAKRVWSYRKALVKYNPKMKGNKDTIWDNHTSVEGDRLSDLVRKVWSSRL